MIPIYFVDAFTTGQNDLFTGNQAAICLMEFDDDILDETKQKIAAEMNLSETAFISKGWKRSYGSFAEKNKYTLRWFTPSVEVELCGHATLASGHVLYERMKEGLIDKLCHITFETKFKGFLGASKNWTTEMITLNFPNNAAKLLDRKEHPWIEEIIRASLGPDVNEDEVQEVLYSIGTKKLLLRLKDRADINGEDRIRKVKADPSKQLSVNTNGLVRGVIVTEKANHVKENIHFYSRYFTPWNGIDEDPVTGSAHTVLASYWKEAYGNEFEVVIGKQCSSRGGLLYCQVKNDKVDLSGQAKTVMIGQINYKH